MIKRRVHCLNCGFIWDSVEWAPACPRCSSQISCDCDGLQISGQEGINDTQKRANQQVDESPQMLVSLGPQMGSDVGFSR